MTVYSPENNIKKQCAVCTSNMRPYAKDYFVCNTCGYMSSVLNPGCGAEVDGINHVRTKNYKIICNLMKKIAPPTHTSILDVGCANGLFLKEAQDAGFHAVGLEPDVRNVSVARSRGFEVIGGFFPDAGQLAGKTFDFIIFNDSFEHIPDLERVMRGIKEHLKEGGIVIVNIPSNRGLIFTLSLLMGKLGIMSSLDRLWQKGFASPHLHYFNFKNLQMLFKKFGFKSVYNAPLSYYTLDHLWKRIRCNTPFGRALIAWCCLVMFYPLYSALKSRSDAFISFFQCDDHSDRASE